jgi:hypothetical protein
MTSWSWAARIKKGEAVHQEGRQHRPPVVNWTLLLRFHVLGYVVFGSANFGWMDIRQDKVV